MLPRILIITLTALFIMEAKGMEQEHSEEFQSLFTYELQNRALANITTTNAVQDETIAQSPDAEFWQAYWRLEKVNQCLYPPIADKYGLSSAPSTWTKVRASFATAYSKLFYDHAKSLVAAAARNYLPKLEKLQSVAPPEDATFFSYVVAQERAQAVALTYLEDGELPMAIKSLQCFVEETLDVGIERNPCLKAIRDREPVPTPFCSSNA